MSLSSEDLPFFPISCIVKSNVPMMASRPLTICCHNFPSLISYLSPSHAFGLATVSILHLALWINYLGHCRSCFLCPGQSCPRYTCPDNSPLPPSSSFCVTLTFTMKHAFLPWSPYLMLHTAHLSLSFALWIPPLACPTFSFVSLLLPHFHLLKGFLNYVFLFIVHCLFATLQDVRPTGVGIFMLHIDMI